jgi:predicted nucleotidyltransferase
MIQLPKDFKEFLQFLNEQNVEYLLVGGYAVGFYGYPRATGDIDIWVSSTPSNMRRLAESLKKFGFSVPPPVESFLADGQFLTLGNVPLRIEILTAIDGVTFDTCFQGRTEGVLNGVSVHLISLHHLKVNKKASGRYKDLADLENLPDL